jgi:hypothetical protein
MPSYHEEMICQAPHTGLAYESNNIVVWNMLRHVFHGGPRWSWIQAHAASMDSRGAYNSMKRHYLYMRLQTKYWMTHFMMERETLVSKNNV